MKLLTTLPLSLIVTALSLYTATHAAEVRVEAGALWLDAGLTASTVVVAAPATLGGDGRIDGNLDLAGTLTPNSPTGGLVGTFSVNGNAVFRPGARFLCDATSHTSLDRLQVTGQVTGICTMVFNAMPGAVPVRQIVIQAAPASDYGGFSPQDSWTWRLAPTGALDLTVTHLRGDSDADGLPDWWEMQFFGGSRTAGSPTADSDGDMTSNWAEYTANTDPTSAESVFRLTSFAIVASNATALTWTTAPGRRYAVEHLTALQGGGCTTAAVITAYGLPEHRWTNAGPPNLHGYYRIAVEENVP